jgi:hypothetical protein
LLPIIGRKSERSSTLPNPEQTDEEAALLARLNAVSDKSVDTATRQINNYSEDDEANEKRWTGAENRRTFYKIRRFFFWFLFFLVCSVATICSVGYLTLVWFWVENLVWGTTLKNPGGLKDLITSVLWTILVIFATLFGESVFKDKER